MRPLFAGVVWWFIGLVWAGAVQATPYLPASDNQVLERLRTRPADPAARELRALRNRLAQKPRDLQLATGLAKRYIEQGRLEADPRYNGYAQAALAPWWNAPHPQPPVLVLRATLRQSNHDFDGAVADLEQARKVAPADPQVWVTLALVRQVRDEYAEAKRDCLPLLHLSTELVAITCLGSVASLNGQAAESFALLERVLARSSTASAAEKLWAQTVLAEMAVRLRHPGLAAPLFKRALATGPDSYLLAAYADFLLDENRPQEAIALLKDHTRVDALLLRLAIAEAAVGAPEAANHRQALAARFAAARLRGDTVHRREEARFALELERQPAQALALALANWQVQREPADARVLLAAALAAQDREAARPVQAWLRRNHLEDARLAALDRQLGR